MPCPNKRLPNERRCHNRVHTDFGSPSRLFFGFFAFCFLCFLCLFGLPHLSVDTVLFYFTIYLILELFNFVNFNLAFSICYSAFNIRPSPSNIFSSHPTIVYPPALTATSLPSNHCSRAIEPSTAETVEPRHRPLLRVSFHGRVTLPESVPIHIARNREKDTIA